MIKHPHLSLICLLTMLSGVGLLSGCGLGKATASIPAATTTPVATATPTVTTYVSSDGQYSLKYPTGWTVKALAAPKTSGAAQFGNSGAADQFIVDPLTVQAVPNYPALLKATMRDPTYFQNAVVDTATATTSYPSGSWIVASATVLFTGEPYTVYLYGIVHSGHTILLETFAPSLSATTDQANYFTPMLTSFTFLK